MNTVLGTTQNTRITTGVSRVMINMIMPIIGAPTASFKELMPLDFGGGFGVVTFATVFEIILKGAAGRGGRWLSKSPLGKSSCGGTGGKRFAASDILVDDWNSKSFQISGGVFRQGTFMDCGISIISQ